MEVDLIYSMHQIVSYVQESALILIDTVWLIHALVQIILCAHVIISVN